MNFKRELFRRYGTEEQVAEMDLQIVEAEALERAIEETCASVASASPKSRSVAGAPSPFVPARAISTCEVPCV